METVLTGGGNYVTYIDDSSYKDYLSYLSIVQSKGFVKYVDNGEGFDKTVFCSTYTKGKQVLNLTYFSKMNRISISFYEGVLSEHLVYQPAYTEQNKKNANTRMHMLELWRLGNSFIFQLKNGHFIISDGGLAQDLPYLLAYLESLVTEGEKPIIEAWFITHAHGDHCGALCQFSKKQEWLDRVIVNGIYYSEPNEEEVLRHCGCEILSYEIKWVAARLKDESGNRTNLYRPQTGQRYYFNDITIDILLSQEQVPFGTFRKDLNTSSTVSLITIEGQKCLFSGDIQEEGLDFLMSNYSREYLSLDFFTLNHHGLNLSLEFADYASAKTMLLTVRDAVPLRKLRETKHMAMKADESVVWGDGTKIFTFPYQTGTYATLPLQEWVYNQGEERVVQPNLYTCPGKLLRGWIFDADTVLLDGNQLQSGAKELLHYLKERNVRISAFSSGRTDDFIQMMKQQDVFDYFALLLGKDMLDSKKPYLDAAQKSEELFGLGHIYQYVVVCNTLEVVEEVIQDGFKTLVPTNGEELSKELKMKCWHTFDSLDSIYDFFELKKVYFEEVP